MTASESPARRLTSEEFRDVIGHFASGVTVITALWDGRRHGTTASAVSSLSLEPPMLVLCMNRASSTGQAIAATGSFAVNILAEEQRALAVHFASRTVDKFAGVAAADGAHGQPLLAGAIAHLECRVIEQVVAGTHYVFIAAVEAASARRGAAPLAYFRGRFGHLEFDEDVAPRDVRTARRVIELGVADVTVGAAPPAAVAELRRLMEAIVPLVGDGRVVDVDAYVRAHGAFHEHMVGLAGSAALLASYRRLGLRGLDARALRDDPAADPRVVADHRLLVEAYERADVELARAVIVRHAERPPLMRVG